MKKYRINDFLGDNSGSQQRFQLNQNLQNRIQRRYEADGSEEEEMQRQNQLLAASQLPPPMTPFGPSMQRNVNNGSAEDSNVTNIDANSLYNKLKELQEAEQRLKQVEDLMRSIEKMENNIKEVKRDSVVNDSRNTSNEMQTKFITRNNVNKHSAKTSFTQPKQMSHSSQSANNISVTNPRKNTIPRNMDENNGEVNVNQSPNTNPHLLSQTMDFCDNNLGYSTDVDESESNSEDSFNLMNGNLIRSMRSQFDSMRSQFETMLPVLENQFTNGNINMNSNQMNGNPNQNNPNNSYINNQFFHLMLLQNYQILQQQQMLLLWLQQQTNPCSQTPLPQPMPDQVPNAHQQHGPHSHHYMNGRHTNISAMPQNSIHYRNSTLNSARNNVSNAHNMPALNNQVVPGVRANNYWDNFKSYSRQNKLSASANRKANENLSSTHNQILSPLITTDQQMIHNTNQTQDLNSLSPNSTLVRQPFKTNANASHVQCVEHVEKQQNLPQFNEMISSKGSHSQHSHHSDSNNFAALFSMLEKLIENDDKYSSKTVPKKKSTNLVITSDNEEEIGAVGGVGVTNVVNNQITSDETNESNGKGSQPPNGSARSQLTGANISIPLHIPASSGAIRKKPRNHEILELSSKADNGEGFGKCLINGSELIRPLMAAEGRSSETGIANAIPSQTTQILSIRPPTTGAAPYDCDTSNASSDDELAEADQTTSELTTTESEIILNNTNNTNNSNITNTVLNTNGTQTNTIGAQLLEISHRSSNEDIVVNGVVNGLEEEEEEEEEDDNLLANDSNEGAIRLSGDGEQGL